MPYDAQLADRVRAYLARNTTHLVEEKEMFRGLAFLVNVKMCVNVSGNDLMCRFDPSRASEVCERPGFRPMVMKGKEMAGYCYVEPVGFRSASDFSWWLQLCLAFNEHAKSSKKSKAKNGPSRT